MKKNKFPFIYKNIFLQSSLQFLGNSLEYFVSHTEKLVVFIAMPRVENKGNVVRLYRHGKLIEEKPFTLSENIFLFYSGWYIHYLRTLARYYSRDEEFFAIVFHPIFFFGTIIQKLWRNIQFVYWVGDYFPGNNVAIVLFEKLKKFYHNRVQFSCYASDTINNIFNGKILDTYNRKTIMLGVDPKIIKRKINNEIFTMLFVGLVKESQGLEYVFDFLKHNKKYRLELIGICEKKLFAKYVNTIKRYAISSQVYFPNKFFSDEELLEVSKHAQAGIALYDPDPSNVTYYTDPGKIKAYTTLGLPVIMTNIPSIAMYIKKFKAGEIVERNNDSLSNALQKVKENYSGYMKGVKRFNKYFYFKDYYREKFKFLESL